MEQQVDPILMTRYFVRQRSISPLVRCMEFEYKNETGFIFLLELYPGVQLWVNDFKMQEIWMPQIEDYHYLKLNCCLVGRCEVKLPDNRYVYLSDSRVSVDLNPAFGWVTLPTARYHGLVLLIDLSVIKENQPAAWKDYGLELCQAEALLSGQKGSWLGLATPEWRQKAGVLAERITKGDSDLEDYRFWTAELLYLLKKGSCSMPAAEQAFLTQGQRAVAIHVEQKLNSDLSKKHRITELAEEQGVSPSALKKYFAQIYGKPISVYVREKRMKQAQKLLSTTQISIADIAAMVGYENQGKFGAAFRKITGATPLEFRRLNHHHFRYKEN
ncbi:helix-turn-helix transcriptional regulator [Eubacterium sp. 1001713B170207_170306_E7]|uniref:helix-turn-helix domain-containing protein n=1 Tax=Eubacterium sp. 1001713B170207_170306_E7 TaxID=2787097 RepID=UPI00189BDC08|nr:helix-turn-helix transcriptional regulator [Eubacterium sp. 1001713B170207_170306_E7]